MQGLKAEMTAQNLETLHIIKEKLRAKFPIPVVIPEELKVFSWTLPMDA